MVINWDVPIKIRLKNIFFAIWNNLKLKLKVQKLNNQLSILMRIPHKVLKINNFEKALNFYSKKHVFPTFPNPYLD